MDNKLPDTIRAFVALSLGDEMMDYLKEQSIHMQEQFAHLNIRWVPFANYHITLVFIGNIPTTDVDKVMAVIDKGINGHGPFEVTVGDHCLFPPDQEKKGVLIASVQHDDQLMKIQDDLKKSFVANDYDIFERPYRPHVTLARLRRSKVKEEELPKYGKTFTVPVTHVHLYRSWKEDGRVFNEVVKSKPLL